MTGRTAACTGAGRSRAHSRFACVSRNSRPDALAVWCPAAALLAACACAVLLLAPMVKAKSYVQLQKEREAAAQLKLA